MTPPAAAAAIPATRPVPARRGAPAAPSRRSPPSAPHRRSRPRRVAAPVRAPGHAAQAAAALAPSRLLDRLIRGRGWIGLVAFALIGIVAMQLWLLKLNGGIGRAIEHEGTLERANAALSAENSSRSAGDLIEQQAVASGMRIVPPGSLIFLRARASDERLAAARLAQPVQTPTQSESSSIGPTGASAVPTSTSAAGATELAASTSTSAAGATELAASTSTSAAGATELAASTSTSAAGATESVASTNSSTAGATESAASTNTSTVPATEAAAPPSTSTTPEAGG